MPDADDFDVEYFRNLLKGNVEKKEQPAFAEPPPSPVTRKKRSAAAPGKKTATKAAGTAKVARKRSKQD